MIGVLTGIEIIKCTQISHLRLGTGQCIDDTKRDYDTYRNAPSCSEMLLLSEAKEVAPGNKKVA